MALDAHAVAASAAGATVSAGVGQVLGMPADAVMWGFFGGIVAVLAVPASNPSPAKRGLAMYLALGGSMLVSVLVAAAMGPLTSAYLDIARIDNALELHAFAFLWGAGAQAGLLVTAIESLRRRIGQLGGDQPSTQRRT